MGMDESPALESYAEGLPPPPSDSTAGRCWLRVVVAALALVAVGLIAFGALRDSADAWLRGTGVVTGTVVDAANAPVTAEVYVVQSDIEGVTDNQGRFELVGVPAGERSIVVAYQGMGHEFPITVVAGGTVDLGAIRVVATAVPDIPAEEPTP